MEEEFDVVGPHEHALEASAETHVPLAQNIALFSAVLATMGAIVSFLGSHTQNDALYYKNEAVLMKARASDAWEYYQAEELKRHLAEQGAAMMPASAEKYLAEGRRYAARAATLKTEAQQFDQRSEAADVESQHALMPHTKLAMSMTFLQVAIALASITALTRRTWLIWAAIAAAAIGVALGAMAWL